MSRPPRASSRVLTAAVLLTLPLAACGDKSPDQDPTDTGHEADTGTDATGDTADGSAGVDADGDGFVADTDGGDDCDDGDPNVHPGADEVCGDSVDDDCDGYAPACRPEGDQDMAAAVATLRGVSAGDSAGRALAGGADLTGDGQIDLVVGAPGEDDATVGRVEIWSGPWTGEHSLADASASFQADTAETRAGYQVDVSRISPDVGPADLIVGSFTRSATFPGGVAWVLRGPLVGAHGVEDAALTITNSQMSAYIGSAVATAGDPTGDGTPDWLVSGSHFDGVLAESGEVWLYSGTQEGAVGRDDAPARFQGSREDGYFGRSVAGPGDVDGDGLDDVLVGADQGEPDTSPRFSGAAYLFLAPFEGDVLDADADGIICGTEDAKDVGWKVGDAGDQDGDGTADLLIRSDASADSEDAAGVAHVFTHPMGFLTVDDASATVLGAYANDFMGWGGMESAGDLDGDGRTDLLLTDFGTEDRSDERVRTGSTYVVWGAVTGHVSVTDVSTVWRSPAELDGSGYAATALGDVTGDGFDDIAVGAASFLDASDPNGLVYVLAGGGL